MEKITICKHGFHKTNKTNWTVFWYFALSICKMLVNWFLQNGTINRLKTFLKLSYSQIQKNQTNETKLFAVVMSNSPLVSIWRYGWMNEFVCWCTTRMSRACSRQASTPKTVCCEESKKSFVFSVFACVHGFRCFSQ